MHAGCIEREAERRRSYWYLTSHLLCNRPHMITGWGTSIITPVIVATRTNPTGVIRTQWHYDLYYYDVYFYNDNVLLFSYYTATAINSKWQTDTSITCLFGNYWWSLNRSNCKRLFKPKPLCCELWINCIALFTGNWLYYVHYPVAIVFF